MLTSPISKTWIMTIIYLLMLLPNFRADIDYLRYVKDGCFVRNEALSCIKYRALKIAKKTFLDNINSNKTSNASSIVSFVNLDNDTMNNLTIYERVVTLKGPRSFISEWAELAKYIMKLVKDYFKGKGIRVKLPDGSRSIEEEEEDARGKRRKLAIVIPFLTLLATLKTKLLLVPILLSVLFVKKLLLIAAFLLPGLLSTLKHCKHHHPMTQYSYFGSDSSDYNSDYSNSYAYSSGGGYGKDWASNRAYSLPKRPPAPIYITAPGNIN